MQKSKMQDRKMHLPGNLVPHFPVVSVGLVGLSLVVHIPVLHLQSNPVIGFHADVQANPHPWYTYKQTDGNIENADILIEFRCNYGNKEICCIWNEPISSWNLAYQYFFWRSFNVLTCRITSISYNISFSTIVSRHYVLTSHFMFVTFSCILRLFFPF